jgi:hypothetical protein
MTLPALTLSLQFALTEDAAAHRAALPRHAVRRWIRHALAEDAAITVRVVDGDEGRALNRDYRHKDYATNVLTFAYDDQSPLAADLVLCAPVVAKEAREAGPQPRGALRPPAGARHAACAGLGPRDQRRGCAGHGSARDRDPGRPGHRRPVSALTRGAQAVGGRCSGIVTGPSLTSATRMSVAKRPVCTTGWAARACATK